MELKKDYEEALRKRGLTALEIPKNTKEKFLCCDSEGYKLYTNIERIKLLKDSKCLRFRKHNPHTKENLELFLKIHGGYSELVEVDTDNLQRKKIKLKCNVCGKIYEKRLCHLIYLNVHRCPSCSYKEFNNRTRYDLEDVKRKFKKKGLTPLFNSYNNNKELLKFRDKNGTIGYKSVTQLKNIHNYSIRGKSLLEHKIFIWLKENDINFITEQSFNDCVYKHKLKFDFYLPDYNICIEVDGRQHYIAIDHFGGEKNFEQTKIRDEIKTEFCKTNGIKLIRIPYWEFKKDSYKTILRENI